MGDGAAMPTTFLLHFKPTENSEARIELMGDVTPDVIGKIEQMLSTFKGDSPKTQQLGQPAEQPATEPEPE